MNNRRQKINTITALKKLVSIVFKEVSLLFIAFVLCLRSISLENVTFKYLNASKNAINNLSFLILNGETIAIVGENGSRQTTLIRLICGLYLPEQGSVKNCGVDTKTDTINNLFENISTVFNPLINFQ